MGLMIVFSRNNDRLVSTREIHIEEDMENRSMNHNRLRGATKNGIGRNARNPMATKNVFPMRESNRQ